MQKFGVRSGDFLVGVIARLEEQKGHIYLLEALAQLIPEFPQLKCLIVGDGKLRPYLEEKAREMGLSESALFVGIQKPINPILNAIDLFLLPSLWEGFSLAILEAMAMGIPVIATAVGGAAEGHPFRARWDSYSSPGCFHDSDHHSGSYSVSSKIPFNGAKR